jgi:hypothetical protein
VGGKLLGKEKVGQEKAVSLGAIETESFPIVTLIVRERGLGMATATVAVSKLM